MPQVVILMGSKSDEEKVSPCVDVLKSLGVSCFITVSSAHRTPERTEELVRRYEAEGTSVFICAAGMAAHLAGAVAARTTRPVIGIPVSSAALCGMDALFATVQMPPGIPVSTIASSLQALLSCPCCLRKLSSRDPARDMWVSRSHSTRLHRSAAAARSP